MKLLILGLLLTGCSTTGPFARYGIQDMDLGNKTITLTSSHYNDMKDLLDSGILPKYGCAPVCIQQTPAGFNEFHSFAVQCK
jgi:hypothetical protein